MKVRAAVVGLIAMVVLCATPGVGVAETASKKTVNLDEAGISLAYPTSWKVITSELVEEDEALRREQPDFDMTTRFAAQYRPHPVSKGQRVYRQHRLVVETTDPDPALPLAPSATVEPSLKAWREDQREDAKYRGYQFVSASKQMVGTNVALRGDFRRIWKERGERHTLRISELHLLAPNRSQNSGRRAVTVRIITSLGDDEKQKAVTDLILGSVRALGTRA